MALHETAQRARALVREQHRREIEGLTNQRDIQRAKTDWMEQKYGRARAWMQAWRAATVCSLVAVAIAYFYPRTEPGWRGIQDAPPLQRVTVITAGYIDADRRWHSFDNGEIITVHLWKP